MTLGYISCFIGFCIVNLVLFSSVNSIGSWNKEVSLILRGL